MNPRPVFIVGSPRSGTTLLASMLAAHSKLSCGPETHIFRWLADAKQPELVDPANWPAAAVQFVCSIRRSSFSDNHHPRLIDHYGIEPEQISVYLQQEDPSIAAIVSSITETYMRTQNKIRWAEKTPDHLKHLYEIRSAFPDAQIVRIIRDPRDVALSLSKVPWGVSSFFEGVLFWLRQDETSRDFFFADPDSYTLQFEALISSPEQELEKLCQFLGEEFEPQMLDTSQTGKTLNRRNVSWKSKSSQPIDHSRTQVWRRELAVEENQLAEALVGKQLTEYGYPRAAEFSQVGEIYPSPNLITKYPHYFEKLAMQGVRFWKTSPIEHTDIYAYVGEPEVDRWLKPGRIQKWMDTLALSGKIARLSTEKDIKIYWMIAEDQDQWSGFSAYMIKRLLSPHRFSAEPNAV